MGRKNMMNATRCLGRSLAVKLVLLCSLSAAFAENTVIKFALAGRISGPFAQICEQMRRGASMVIEDINARGETDGRKVELDVADDKGAVRRRKIWPRTFPDPACSSFWTTSISGINRCFGNLPQDGCFHDQCRIDQSVFHRA